MTPFADGRGYLAAWWRSPTRAGEFFLTEGALSPTASSFSVGNQRYLSLGKMSSGTTPSAALHTDGHVHLARTTENGSVHMPMGDGLSPHLQGQHDIDDGAVMATNLCRTLTGCWAGCSSRTTTCGSQSWVVTSDPDIVAP